MLDGPSTRPIRVLVADDIARAVAHIGRLADYADSVDVIGVARQPMSVFEEARLLQPDVLLFHDGFGGMDPEVVASELAEVAPDSCVVLLTTPEQAEIPVPGVAAVLSTDAPGQELLEALRRVTAGRTGQAGGTAGAPQLVPTFQITEPTADVAPTITEAHPSLANNEMLLEPIEPVRQRVRSSTRSKAECFIVFSGKGGVGKSVVATNLAVALSSDGSSKVAIIDLDLQFGDVAVMLGAESHPTSIEALAQQGEQVEPEFIEDVMATGPEEVRILVAPTSPEFADLVTTGNLRAILRELGKGYDYIIVDAPAHLEERTLEVIEMADQIVVVTAFNITAVKDTKIMLKLLQSLGIPKDHIVIVLNQTRAKVNFPRAEVEESLRFRILTQLPFEPKVDDSVDNGQPLWLSEPRSDFIKQFRTLVDYLVPQSDEEEGEGGKGRPAASKANRRRFSLGRG
jgi:pilus assembly protein CpaE